LRPFFRKAWSFLKKGLRWAGRPILRPFLRKAWSFLRILKRTWSFSRNLKIDRSPDRETIV